MLVTNALLIPVYTHTYRRALQHDAYFHMASETAQVIGAIRKGRPHPRGERGLAVSLAQRGGSPILIIKRTYSISSYSSRKNSDVETYYTTFAINSN